MFIHNSELLCLSSLSCRRSCKQNRSHRFRLSHVVPCFVSWSIVKHRDLVRPEGRLWCVRRFPAWRSTPEAEPAELWSELRWSFYKWVGQHTGITSFTVSQHFTVWSCIIHQIMPGSAPFWNQQWSVLLRISWNILKQSCDEKSHCGWLVARPCPGHPGHPAQFFSAMAIHGGSAGTHWLISIPAQGSMRKPWRMGHFLALDTWYSLDVVGLLKFINCGDLWCLGRPDVSSKAHLHGSKDEAGQRHHHSGEEETCRRLCPEPTEFGPLGEQSSYVQLHPPNSSKIVIEQSIKKGSRQVPRGRCQFWAAV